MRFRRRVDDMSNRNHGEEPGWRHPLFFYPFFLIASLWVPVTAMIGLDSKQAVVVRTLGAISFALGVIILVWMIRWYRRR